MRCKSKETLFIFNKTGEKAFTSLKKYVILISVYIDYLNCQTMSNITTD